MVRCIKKYKTGRHLYQLNSQPEKQQRAQKHLKWQDVQVNAFLGSRQPVCNSAPHVSGLAVCPYSCHLLLKSAFCSAMLGYVVVYYIQKLKRHLNGIHVHLLCILWFLWVLYLDIDTCSVKQICCLLIAQSNSVVQGYWNIPGAQSSTVATLWMHWKSAGFLLYIQVCHIIICMYSASHCPDRMAPL